VIKKRYAQLSVEDVTCHNSSTYSLGGYVNHSNFWNVAQTNCFMLTLCIVEITVNYGIKHIKRTHAGNLSTVVRSYMINTEGY